MKRLALYIIMCLAATSMSGSWHYEENNTFIASADEYISGDYDQPTTLAIYVVSHRGVNGVVGGIFGEYCIHDFRPSQQYVMIDFGQGRERWKVRPFEVNGTAAMTPMRSSASCARLSRSPSRCRCTESARTLSISMLTAIRSTFKTSTAHPHGQAAARLLNHLKIPYENKSKQKFTHEKNTHAKLAIFAPKTAKRPQKILHPLAII